MIRFYKFVFASVSFLTLILTILFIGIYPQHGLLLLVVLILFTVLGVFLFGFVNSIFLKLNFLILYISYVLGYIVVILNRQRYTESGWDGIGHYDFSIFSTIEAYAYVLLYVTLFVLFGTIFDMIIRIQHGSISNLNGLKRSLVLVPKFVQIEWLLIVILVMQSIASFYMLGYGVGIIGVVPDSLPYKIAGMLYYTRLFVIPMLVSFVLFKTSSINLILILLVIVESLIAGFTSGSKSLLILHLLPIVAISLYRNKPLLAISMVILIISFSPVVNGMRGLYYWTTDFSLITFEILFDHLKLKLELSYTDSVFKSLTDYILRLGGTKEFFASFFNDSSGVGVGLFFDKALNLNILSYNSFNVAQDVYNLVLLPGYAFGISVDDFSLLYSSTNNLVLTSLLMIAYVLYFLICEKLITLSFPSKYKGLYLIIFIHAYFLYSFVNPNIGEIFIILPLVIVTLRIIFLYIYNISFLSIAQGSKKI